MAKVEKNQNVSPSIESEISSIKRSEDLKQLHVNIPTTLHKRFRVKVLEEGRSMNEVIENLIKDYIGR
jgi:hypothetical protein